MNIKATIAITFLAMSHTCVHAASAEVRKDCTDITNAAIMLKIAMQNDPNFYEDSVQYAQTQKEPLKSKLLDTYYEINKRKNETNSQVYKYLYSRCLLDFNY